MTLISAVITMYSELDAIDRKLLALLQHDARLSNKQLAASLGIAQSTCSTRMRRLEAIGAIRGYHASVHPEALGVGLHAIIAVTLIRHTNKEIGDFWAHTRSVPEVVNTYHVTGDTDFLVQVATRDSNHLQELATTTFTAWPEVGRIRTAVVFQLEESHNLPDLTPQ